MDNNFGKRIAWLLRSIAALLGAVALYAAFMWPSHRHLGDGIPYTSYNAEVAEARTLVPGDPLQLLYHFQLVRGMFSGRVPPFTNLYEFNLGDDDGRRAFDPYYVPFSLLFAATSPALGDAAAWNLSLFTAVLLGFLLLLALARRFQGDEASEALAFAAAFIATCVPYRWVTLAGGSPTGFGIALIGMYHDVAHRLFLHPPLKVGPRHLLHRGAFPCVIDADEHHENERIQPVDVEFQSPTRSLAIIAK